MDIPGFQAASTKSSRFSPGLRGLLGYPRVMGGLHKKLSLLPGFESHGLPESHCLEHEIARGDPQASWIHVTVQKQLFAREELPREELPRNYKLLPRRFPCLTSNQGRQREPHQQPKSCYTRSQICTVMIFCIVRRYGTTQGGLRTLGFD